ncbi:MAG: inositol monophosphatase [Burkholderiales bacterium]|nr:inositol monophosphatase [Burkholderiales bacterium]
MIDWAHHVGEIQLSFLHGEKDVQFKGEIDLVTAADKASEEYLIAKLEHRFPLHDYIAEEGHRRSTGADFTWYIDPLDGTTNFAHGYPVFCVSIALILQGERALAVVHDPSRNETFTAVRGHGAFLNGRSLKVSPQTVLRKSLLLSGFPYAFADDERNVRLWNAFLHAAQSVRRDGSAALDLCYVAAGRVEGFWEMGLNSWDIAAGALVIEEAGGRVTQFDDSPLQLDGKAILASNGNIHAAMQVVLKEHGAY